MTGYLKKQLAEIKLPSAPRPGLNIKQTFKGVLADLETRERWVSRFAYWLVDFCQCAVVSDGSPVSSY
jgi:mediator of RNA polymerase II transcription subunit 12